MSLLRKQESRQVTIDIDSRLRGNDMERDKYNDGRDSHRQR